MKALKTIAFALLTTLLFFGQAFAANYSIDKSKSTVKWNGKKVTGEHYGQIQVKDASFNVENNMIKGGTITIDMATITSEDVKDANMNGKLVGHLKSDDFFGVEKFPVSTMVVTGVKKLQGNEYEYTANLTIKGITKPVTFTATSKIEGKSLVSSGKIVINRALYDVRYGSGSFVQGLGDKLIYDDFTLDFNITANSL